MEHVFHAYCTFSFVLMVFISRGSEQMHSNLYVLQVFKLFCCSKLLLIRVGKFLI